MKVVITGASGFLGKAIKNAIKTNYLSIGRSNADIICDLSYNVPTVEGDLIIHAAGKAHMIPKTEKEKQDFYRVNVLGTKNLIKGISTLSKPPRYFTFISSVAVYGLIEGSLINEQAPLLASDPYGLSKIQAERLIQEWCAEHNVVCTILRLPLLIGANPPGNLGEMVKAIKKGYYVNIAGGVANKSMVLAEDVANFILPASILGGIYNLTDGYHPNFNELSNLMAKQLHKKTPRSIPLWIAKSLAKAGDLLGGQFPFNSYKLSKIRADLTFDDTKARKAFGWNPRKVLDAFEVL